MKEAEAASLPSDDRSPFPLTAAQAYAFFYGASPPPDAMRHLRHHGADGPVHSLQDARRLIMALDRQTYVTPALVRFDADEVTYAAMDGFSLALDVADVAISATIAASRTWEPALTSVVQRYLRPGWVVADIGANVGYYAMLARSLVGPSGHVYAFEPNSENARLILHSVARNGFGNITLLPLALSNCAGYAHFTSAIGSNGGLLGTDRTSAGVGGVVIPTMRLDDLIEGPLDFVKMDTEGAEGRIVQGAERILSTCRPIVSTELSCEMLPRVSDVSPRDYLGLFRHYGYAIHRIDPDTHRLDPVGDVDAFLADWGSLTRIDDLLMLPAGAPLLQPSG